LQFAVKRSQLYSICITFQPKQPRYNAETEAAIQETKDILAGKIKAKSYANVKEMIEDLGLK